MILNSNLTYNYKKRFMHKILSTSVIFLSFLYSQTTYATTVEEALTSGYKNNEELKYIRTEFLDSIEAYPRALAGFMPKISANISSAEKRYKSTGKDAFKSNGTTQSISLTQPIFDGWSTISEIKAAQFSFLAARASFYAKEQDIFLKEINVYLSCVEAKEKFEISRISVKSNKTQLEAMEEKFKLGEATATEVATAKEGLATAKANKAIALANYENYKSIFFQTFGIDAEQIKMPSVASNIPSSLDALTKSASSSNFSIEKANNQQKAAKLGESASKGRLLPRASVSVAYGKTKYDKEDVSTATLNNESTTTTLSLTVPILEKGGIEYSDIRRSKLATKQSIIALDSAMKQLKANCQSEWAEFDASKSRLEATEQAVKSAEIAYDGMIQEEMLGSRTIIDVLRSEERLNKARESKIEAKKSMILSSYKLKALTASLTAKNMGLNVEYFNPENEFKRIKNKIIGF